MKSLLPILVLFTMLAAPLTGFAAPTTAVLGGGVSINEILIDPIGGGDFDTDGSGTAAINDEFVELYNGSSSAIDISGWQLWDEGVNNWFTFPGTADDGTTTLPAGAYAVVVVGVQAGGALPTMTNPNSLAFDAGRGSAVLNNGDDNVVLYDPGEDQFVQLLYSSSIIDDPTSSGYAGFSATATRVGSVEDWGNETDGVSLTRYPSGEDTIGQHSVITPGGGAASPTAVFLTNSHIATSFPLWGGLFFAALLLATVIIFARNGRFSPSSPQIR